MTQSTAESEYGLWQIASVEQFHEDRNRAADSAFSRLPFANGANVADPQTRSKTGLRESGPLANGFEGRGRQSILPIEPHMRRESVALERGWLPESPRTIRVARLNDEPFDETNVDDLSDVPNLLCARGVVTVESATAVCPSGAITSPCHLHSPVSGGAWPRDASLIHRPNGPVNYGQQKYVETLPVRLEVGR